VVAVRVLALLSVLVFVACGQRDQSSAARPDASSEAAPVALDVAAKVVSPSAATSEPARPPREPASAAVPLLPVRAWVWTTYKGDHFSILFPGEPKVSELPAEEDKAGYSQALLDVPGGQVSFAAGYTEHSAEEVERPEAFLDDRAHAPRRGFTEVIHERSFTLPGGQPGRVLIQRRNLSGTPLRVYSRLHLVGRRLYSLIVSTLDAGGVGEDAAKKFMDSFKLR